MGLPYSMSGLFTSLILAGTLVSSYTFNDFISVLDSNNRSFIVEENIGSFDDLLDYGFKNRNISSNTEAIRLDNLAEHLVTMYPDYSWSILDDYNLGFASGGNINEMLKSDKYSLDEFMTQLLRGYEQGNPIYSREYPGCGPIAAMGVLDYFANVLDYDDIISDTESLLSRAKALNYIVNQMNVYHISGKNYMTLPWDFVNCVDSYLEKCNVDDDIQCNYIPSLIGNEKVKFSRIITENLLSGYPVTLAVGSFTQNRAITDFDGHYSNIYGYIDYVGYNRIDGTYLYKRFYKAKLNGGNSYDYVCDEEILDNAFISIITYNNATFNSDILDTSSFEGFVNEQGGGQYFFYEKQMDISSKSGKVYSTERLRTSLIEDDYLVMSPNRLDAGKAYLTLNSSTEINRIEFDSSLWSSNEYIDGQNFMIEYLEDGIFTKLLEYNLKDFNTSKDDKKRYYIILPDDVTTIRFITTKENPTTSYNKGRICLDNITLYG